MRPPVLQDLYDRLNDRVHVLYLICEAEVGPDYPDDDFIHLHDLKVECDATCNRLVRAINAFELRHPEAA